MAYVVTDKCVDCRYTTCVDVCPVECFHIGENTVIIDPDTCIDCSLCEPECPIEAIVSDNDNDDRIPIYLEFAERMSKEWPVIPSSIDPLPSADSRADTEDKWSDVSEEPGRI